MESSTAHRPDLKEAHPFDFLRNSPFTGERTGSTNSRRLEQHLISTVSECFSLTPYLLQFYTTGQEVALTGQRDRVARAVLRTPYRPVQYIPLVRTHVPDRNIRSLDISYGAKETPVLAPASPKRYPLDGSHRLNESSSHGGAAMIILMGNSFHFAVCCETTARETG